MNQQELDNLKDLKVTIHVELGRKKIMISELLKTNYGSVIELDHPINEPFTFFVNNKPFGKGTLVQMPDGKKGLKILEIFKPPIKK